MIILVLTSGSLSVLATFCPLQTAIPQRAPSLQRKWKTLYLCLVTTGSNRHTVLRSVSQMKALQTLDHRIHFVILTEQGRDFDATTLGVDVIFIPKAYRPHTAKYKARALEYFRVYQKLGTEDWTLHLDEETYVDKHCLQTCVEFIENTGFEWGQGIIMYNTVNYWESSLLTFAEILRFREDLGRFQLQHSRLHYTCVGCHGSFLLSSGRVENAVTFETSCLAEDFWFADRACKLGFGGGWIPSIAREQCNFTIRDFLNQRRRWFCGMWQVGFWGRVMDLTWVLSVLEMPLVVFIWVGHVTLPPWLIIWMHAYLSSHAFSGMFAMVLQDLDAGMGAWQVLWHITQAPVLSVAVQCIQMAAILYSIFCPPAGFDVVKKK